MTMAKVVQPDPGQACRPHAVLERLGQGSTGGRVSHPPERTRSRTRTTLDRLRVVPPAAWCGEHAARRLSSGRSRPCGRARTSARSRRRRSRRRRYGSGGRQCARRRGRRRPSRGVRAVLEAVQGDRRRRRRTRPALTPGPWDRGASDAGGEATRADDGSGPDLAPGACPGRAPAPGHRPGRRRRSDPRSRSFSRPVPPRTRTDHHGPARGGVPVGGPEGVHPPDVFVALAPRLFGARPDDLARVADLVLADREVVPLIGLAGARVPVFTTATILRTEHEVARLVATASRPPPATRCPARWWRRRSRRRKPRSVGR
jgi:hypothetical protein